MHLNPNHPNILHDMQAAANGRDLRNRNQFGHLTAKRHLVKRGNEFYHYASERQLKRQQRRVHARSHNQNKRWI